MRRYFHSSNVTHWYPHTAETYRAFVEIGTVWRQVGIATNRSDITVYGSMLLDLAPSIYEDLHMSLKQTVNTTASPGHQCYTTRADGYGAFLGCNFRAVPELFYSGALTAEQTEAFYNIGLGLTDCPLGRFLGLGVPAGGGGTRMFVHIPQGFPYGLLVHDMIEPFLLYFFTHSAHTNTRGTFTTPESSTLDRNGYDYSYASAGVANVPLCLKWMLCFEEPETHTLWLAKATPRDWLVVGESPLVASNLTTRYGRISYTIKAATVNGTYTIHASVRLPSAFFMAPPDGGIRLRIRAPLAYAGRLSGVTVGSTVWSSFNASTETINFSADELLDPTVQVGLVDIVATFHTV